MRIRVKKGFTDLVADFTLIASRWPYLDNSNFKDQNPKLQAQVKNGW